MGDSHTWENLRSRDKVKVQTVGKPSWAVHTRGHFSLGLMFDHEFVAGEYEM